MASDLKDMTSMQAWKESGKWDGINDEAIKAGDQELAKVAWDLQDAYARLSKVLEIQEADDAGDLAKPVDAVIQMLEG